MSKKVYIFAHIKSNYSAKYSFWKKYKSHNISYTYDDTWSGIDCGSCNPPID